MLIQNKNGQYVKYSEKIMKEYVKSISYELDTNWINVDELIKNLTIEMSDNMTTTDLYELLAKKCAVKVSQHPDYNNLASRICVGLLHKNTDDDILKVATELYNNIDQEGKVNHLISKDTYDVIVANHDIINKTIDYKRDYLFDYFGLKTLERSYLLKIYINKKPKIIERPQHMILRVAIGIHGDNLSAVFETYDYMSRLFFTHATPTLFNAGTPRAQLSSCFKADTEVLTINDGVKFIQDVKIGDEVVTHSGKIQKVAQLHKNPLGDRNMYKLQVDKSKDIYVTGNHRFWSVNKKRNTEKCVPEWKSIEELSKPSGQFGNYIGIPNHAEGIDTDIIDVNDYINILKTHNDGKREYTVDLNQIHCKTIWTHNNLNNNEEVTVSRNGSSINRIWKVDQDFANFIGIFFGDGNLIYGNGKKDSPINRGIAITIHKDHKKEIEFVTKIGEKVFGIKSSVHQAKDQNCCKISFNSSTVGVIFETLFGRGFEGKYLPKMMYKWSNKLVYSFMAGLITTDGCITKDGSILVQLSNKRLTNEIYHLCRSHGLEISLKELKMPKLGTVIPYKMFIPRVKEILDQTMKVYPDNRLEKCYQMLKGENACNFALTLNGNKFLKIKSIEKLDIKPEFVYTLGIENDHSYNVEGLLCENCFIMSMMDDLSHMMKVQSDIAQISKWSGGIGLTLTDIRAKGSIIRGTNGESTGIIPLCIVLGKIAKWVNQGGKRNGSIAVYLEPWHADIFAFCELRKPEGDDDLRARDLFLGLWIPDLFMKRVQEDGNWSLMCPDECKGLSNSYGREFEKLYIQYEKEGKFKKQVKAKDLWLHILESQIETGLPYMCFKDNVNKKTNHQNIGVIKSSNLCTEIMEFYDKDEIAVCNLASICLPRFVKTVDGKTEFDFAELLKVAKIVTRNLDKIIDVNYYPVEETRTSNSKNRPIGVGVQGLADVYKLFRYAYGSDEARLLNKKIFETIYFGCLQSSNELAVLKKEPYERFKNSPFSKGKLQFHMWGLKEENLEMGFDWKTLIENIQKDGVTNSLLTTIMPTASTSQIMGNVEACEPQMSNIYVRKTLAGEYIVVNESLVRDLIKLNLWNDTIRAELLYDNGSIQNIDEIPKNIKELYKTAHEMKQKDIVIQCVERGPFIDQSQSMNLFLDEPNFDKLSSSHFYSWKNGIKTGMYYLHSKPAVDPIQFGIDPDVIKQIKMKKLKFRKYTDHKQETKEREVKVKQNAITYVIGDKPIDVITDIVEEKPTEEKPMPVCKLTGKKRENMESCVVCT